MTYPAVVMWSDHHVGPTEHEVYLVENDWDLTCTLKHIADQYKDWDSEAHHKVIWANSLMDMCELMSVNNYKTKNFFDGRVHVLELIKL